MERALVACLQLAVALAVLGALALARFIYQVVESRGQLEWDPILACDTTWNRTALVWHNAMAFAADKRDLHAWLNGHCPSNRGGFYSVWRPELYQNVRAGDVIFLPADHLERWAAAILPTIGADSKFVLVTAGSDKPGESIAPRAAKLVVKHAALVGWWSQNTVMAHPKVHPMPIGINYLDAATHAQFVRGFHPLHLLTPWRLLAPQDSPLEQERQILTLLADMPPTRKRILKAWCDFQFDRDNAMRQQIWRMLQSSPESSKAIVAPPVSYASKMRLYQAKAQYMFDVSPPGHGIDCVRTWEALALGMIPIVLISHPPTPLDALFNELPVVRVRNYSEITPARLRTWASTHEKRKAKRREATRETTRVDARSEVSLTLPDGRRVVVPAPLTTAWWVEKWKHAATRAAGHTDATHYWQRTLMGETHR